MVIIAQVPQHGLEETMWYREVFLAVAFLIWAFDMYRLRKRHDTATRVQITGYMVWYGFVGYTVCQWAYNVN